MSNGKDMIILLITGLIRKMLNEGFFNENLSSKTSLSKTESIFF